MAEHYKILGVPYNASTEEIKRAFRRLTKRFHPDRNAGRTQWATAQMKRILEANRVLSNPTLRSAYDRKHGIVAGQQKTARHAKHRAEGDSLRARSARVLEDLLSGNEARAVEEYEKLLREHADYDLTKYLEVRDWVDCKFLLAEQYERRNQPERALGMYEELYASEQAHRRSPFFRHEAHDRILRLCCQLAARHKKPNDAAQYYLRALALDLSGPQKAFLHKKLAECHLAFGDSETARRHLNIAFQLKPNLKGAIKIRARLGA